MSEVTLRKKIRFVRCYPLEIEVGNIGHEVNDSPTELRTTDLKKDRTFHDRTSNRTELWKKEEFFHHIFLTYTLYMVFRSSNSKFNFEVGFFSKLSTMDFQSSNLKFNFEVKSFSKLSPFRSWVLFEVESFEVGSFEVGSFEVGSY